MNLGKVIQATRIEKGFTQLRLSEEAGITRTYLSLIENGERLPSYGTLNRLAALLGKDVFSMFVEAELDKYDEDFELINGLTKIIESKDERKLEELKEFVKSL